MKLTGWLLVSVGGKEPIIFDICNCLADYCHKWRTIGEGLEVRNVDLASIKHDSTLDNNNRLAEMLRTWKDS